ncbi:hypothetical protein [Thiocystis violacea]|uniref:hypothetical protein n=1 Tax=Thiocystis violacea TaxID=13725 RepID=UPI001A924BA1|nr:hypothetical protein [Thiocystis violacea]MBK1725259.1 hypothetical protein [Thiocystis violacea]
MGMFDSLYIELDGRELPIQTKRFDCVLGDYRLGDWIGGAAPGIRVYFDILSLDAKGALVYGADAERARTLTLFVVLAHGVFVDYRIRDGELAPDAIEHALMELREAWQDSARLLGFLIETLRTRQQRIEMLARRLARIASVVESTRRLRAGETFGDRFRLIHEEQRKLDAGEDPLDVVAWVLDDKKADSGRWGEGTVTDPLDDYRL